MLGLVLTALTSPRAQPAPTATSTSNAPVLLVDTSAVVETDLVDVNADLHHVLAQAQTENSQVIAENEELLVEHAEYRQINFQSVPKCSYMYQHTLMSTYIHWWYRLDHSVTP
jgi:hypothetical protein